ncbi:unnamed protein product [Macrosiphum euphorbiae]|uniref:Uncharacterized protein n=1 Tax=Macrosiphum euphorbiae TaxID=13131 RepID=A0AAV0XXH3_9HEMI|nr:unnamed protein product [Macrosiphum euphorbiae]
MYQFYDLLPMALETKNLHLTFITKLSEGTKSEYAIPYNNLKNSWISSVTTKAELKFMDRIDNYFPNTTNKQNCIIDFHPVWHVFPLHTVYDSLSCTADKNVSIKKGLKIV